MPPLKYKNSEAVPDKPEPIIDKDKSAYHEPPPIPHEVKQAQASQPQHKKYITRLVQTGMSAKDVQKRMQNAFDELCPAGWSYHSMSHINSSEAVMIFEMYV